MVAVTHSLTFDGQKWDIYFSAEISSKGKQMNQIIKYILHSCISCVI